MRRLNPLQELFTPLGLAAGRPITPGIVATPRHIEHFTHQVHRKLLGMLLNEGESHGWCFAKKAVAFFKISRSMRSRLFSSRRRRTSARRPVSGATFPAAAGNFLSHNRSVVAS